MNMNDSTQEKKMNFLSLVKIFIVKKKYLLTLIFFLLITILFSLFGELYRSPIMYLNNSAVTFVPLPKNILQSIASISLENNSGKYFLYPKVNKETALFDWWIDLSNGHQGPIDVNQVNSLFKFLNKIQIKKALTKDKINLNNFSLEKPTLKMTIQNTNHETVVLLFGIFNSIDKTAYLTLDNSNYIYQIDTTSINIDLSNIPSLLDSNLFYSNLKDFISLKIIQKQQAPSATKSPLYKLILTNSDNIWRSQVGKEVTRNSLNELLLPILELKGNLIFFKNNNSFENIINFYIQQKNTLYSFEIEDKNHNLYKYEISIPINENKIELSSLNKNGILLNQKFNSYYLVPLTFYELMEKLILNLDQGTLQIPKNSKR